MRKILLVLVVLLFAGCLLAQDSMSKSADATTIQGCLSRNGSYYYLTDSSGKKYHLASYNGKHIEQHVGHEVKITGTMGIKTESTTASTGVGSSAKEIPVFRVKSIEHVADSCTTM